MADIEEVITGDTSELVEALQAATDVAAELAEALKQVRDTLAELEGAGTGAEADAEALDSLRNAAAEAGQALESVAESGAGLSDIAAAAEADAKAVGQLRDNLAETAAAEDAVAGSAGGLIAALAGLEADYAAAVALRDSLTELTGAEAEAATGAAVLAGSSADTAAGLETEAEAARTAALAYDELAASQADAAAVAAAQGLTLDEFGRKLAAVAEEAAARLGDADAEITAMSGGASSLGTSAAAAGDDVAEFNESFAVALEEWRQLDAAAATAGTDTGSLASGFRDLAAQADRLAASGSITADELEAMSQQLDSLNDGLNVAEERFGAVKAGVAGAGAETENAVAQFGRLDEAMAPDRFSGGMYANASAEMDAIGAGAADAALGVQDMEGALRDAEGAMSDGEMAGAELEGLFGDVGSAAGEAAGAIGQIPLFGAAIGAAVVAAAGFAPAVVAAAAGIVSFGLLAAPALDKVKHGLTAVTQAQQAYTLAQAVQARDPTKANLAAEQKALATLQATWAQMPAPVSAAVEAVRQFEHAWSQAGQKSGIQDAALSDITKAVKDAQDALPAIEQLARAAEPVIGGMLTDIGKNLDSKDFRDFTTSIAREAPSAASALHQLAGGVSDYLSGLQEKGAGASSQFVASIARLMRTTSPDAVTATVNSISLLTHAINGLDAAAKNPAVDAFGHALDAIWHAGAWNWKEGGKLTKDLFGLTATTPPVIKIPPVDTSALRKSLTAGGLPPVELRTQFSPAEMRRSLDAAGPMDVKAKVQQVDTAALKRSLTADAGPEALTAKAKVQADTSGMQKQVSDAAKNVKIAGVEVDLASAKLSGLAALQPVLSQAGKAAGQDFDRGIMSAITSGDASALAAARHLASGIRAAFSGLPGEMRAVGQDADQGLAQGIAAGQGAAVAAARALAAAVEAAARVQLQTQSPSKVFLRIGQMTVAGFVTGLLGGQSEVNTAIADVFGAKAVPYANAAITNMITKMRDEVVAAAKAGVISTSAESAYSKWLGEDNRRLLSLAQRRAGLEATISAADALAASVKATEISAASVTSAYGMTYIGQASQAPVYGSIKAALEAQLKQTREFRADIAKLKKEGLGESSIQALLAAGVSGGLPVAQQLLSGGKGGIRQIDELEKEIAAAAGHLGVTGANASYESGREIGKGLAAGLRSQLNTIDNEMKKIADELVAALKRALRISSPSQATTEIGSMLGEGLISGMEAKREAIRAAGERMAMSAVSAPMATAAGGYGPGSAGSDVTVLHVTTPIVIDGKVAARSNQKYTLQKARRNTRSGLQLQGRGT